MPNFICRTCGVQFPESAEPPPDCPICEDERQYVGWGGQVWTTLEAMRAGEYRNRIAEEGPGVVGIGTEPGFAIGQRALLVEAAGGNVLWDCITLLDDDTVAAIEARGGLTAIAISHPHYYGTLADWSRAFGDVPVYVHEDDRKWVMRTDANVEFWSGDRLEIADGLTLLNCRIHFAGGTVLHWAGGDGALLSGDIFQVVMDRRWVSFMYSYPNLIPEHPVTVRRAVALTEPFAFTRIYGAWWGRIAEGGREVLVRSAERYLRHLGLGD